MLTLKRLFELVTTAKVKPKDVEEVLRLEGIPEKTKLKWAARLWQRCLNQNPSHYTKEKLEKIKREVPLGKEAYLLSVLMTNRRISEKDLEELSVNYREIAKVIAYSPCVIIDQVEYLLKKFPLEKLLKHADDADIIKSILEMCEDREIVEAFGKLSLSEVKEIIKRLGTITNSFLVEFLLEAAVSCGHNPLTLIFLIAKACEYKGEPIFREEILYALDEAKCTPAQRRRFLRALRCL
ncbi:hypothetical protein [Desulfurobacterium sp.]|uniref:hypothetical protein n=1 Tax=Desulfurobacterium sp. TaxID=2004706 RepID=UPI002627FD86|nr:hypothetical protein [Desulfurobacterium sp.]